MFDLTGKTALVTGASGGIGEAIARAFHQQGATVALSGTRREVLDRLCGELADRAHALPCNLANKDEVEALVPKCEEVMGKLDILVANAGINKDNLLVQLRDEDWDEVVAINLTANFRLARGALRGMMRRRFGRIIGIGSVVGFTGNPGQANYTATKAGMVGMIKSIAAEYAKRGVTANCIAPGLIATAMTDKLNDKQRETILARVPAGRLGAGADVAAAAVFLASQEAAYITGQTLHVNGGMAMI
jgi:3-oxoacyl-[acyl-carrier protein] reductase